MLDVTVVTENGLDVLDVILQLQGYSIISLTKNINALFVSLYSVHKVKTTVQHRNSDAMITLHAFDLNQTKKLNNYVALELTQYYHLFAHC